MFDLNIFITELEEKNRQNQMRIPKLICTVNMFCVACSRKHQSLKLMEDCRRFYGSVPSTFHLHTSQGLTTFKMTGVGST